MNVKAVRYNLAQQPGFVSFEFKYTKDNVWTITEKLPVVGLPYPTDGTNIPFEVEAPSQVIKSYYDENDKEILKIEFLYQIESDDGEREFEVFASDYYS